MRTALIALSLLAVAGCGAQQETGSTPCPPTIPRAAPPRPPPPLTDPSVLEGLFDAYRQVIAGAAEIRRAETPLPGDDERLEDLPYSLTEAAERVGTSMTDAWPLLALLGVDPSSLTAGLRDLSIARGRSELSMDTEDSGDGRFLEDARQSGAAALRVAEDFRDAISSAADLHTRFTSSATPQVRCLMGLIATTDLWRQQISRLDDDLARLETTMGDLADRAEEAEGMQDTAAADQAQAAIEEAELRERIVMDHLDEAETVMAQLEGLELIDEEAQPSVNVLEGEVDGWTTAVSSFREATELCRGQWDLGGDR